MRIAMVGCRGIPTRTGGVERVVENLTAELRRRGHEVLVYARGQYLVGLPDRPPGFAPAQPGVIVTPGLSGKHLETITHTATAMLDVLRRKVDVVHVHSPGPALLSWIPWAAGRAVVFTVHAPDWRRDRWSAPARLMLRAGLACGMKLARAVTAVSRPLAEELAGRYGRPVLCVPNGTPPAQPAPPRRICRWGLQPDQYVLHVGRIVPEKRLALLLEAWPPAGAPARGDVGTAEIPAGWPLVVVGDPAEPAYARQCRRLAQARDVRFLGPQRGPALAELYSHAAAVVQPSALEGMSMVLLEAAAYGRCVVAADTPESRDALGDTALYFRVDDLAELRAAVRRCLQEGGLRHRYGQMALRRAGELSLAGQAARMEQVYRDVLDRPERTLS